MHFTIDGALYPDTQIPDRLDSLGDRVDFIARLCAAWDFGRLPDVESIQEVRGEAWRTAVDETRLLTSVSYHLLRRWHALPELPWLGQSVAAIADDPSLQHI